MRKEDIPAKMEAVGADVAELARYMGVDYYAARRIAKGERKSLSAEEIEAVKRFLDLKENRQKPVYDPPEPASTATGFAQANPRAEIPLYGGGDTREGWKIILNPSSAVGRVMAHPAQMRASKAFAVEVVDATMEPRLMPGEIVYVSGGLTPRPGQDCLVEYDDMTARILQFVQRSERMVIFRQLNPQREFHFKPGDKFTAHAIVGRG